MDHQHTLVDEADIVHQAHKRFAEPLHAQDTLSLGFEDMDV